MTIKICAFSDTHGQHQGLTLPKCDIAIHCGDFVGDHRNWTHYKWFLSWYDKQINATHKIYIAGNHDRWYESKPEFKRENLIEYPNIHYLENSGITLMGLNIWGSPYTPEFNHWAFNLPRGGDELYKTWQLIPRNTDILVTHGPPNRILDRCNAPHPKYPQDAGCELLRHRIEELADNLKYHFCGHVHEGFGMDYRTLSTTIVNASTCTLAYKPTNPFVVVDV